MKIIDLLVKIANEEEVPVKFKCDGYVWKYKETMKDWYCYNNKCYLFSGYFKESLKNCLWYEVEIVEEDEKPKEIKHIGSCQNRNEKINQIIDAVNYLLKKEDNK